MKNSFSAIFIIASIILLPPIIKPVNALNAPVPRVSASIYYPDTCNPEFYVDFEISNLGTISSADSYLAVSISSNLDFVNWHTTPHIPDLNIRIFEIGDPMLNISGLPISTENVIIELYNHSFNSAESVTVTLCFELTLYQSSTESVKYNLVMYPEGVIFPSFSSIFNDPAISSIKNQQGYPVYELGIPTNNIIVESDPENIDTIPEFPSLIFLPIFLTTTLIVTIYRKRMKK
ncbi:hypothetical protein MUO71_02225 [Candidatus Bathyarchaeota archaeon]|nr:hypothetical protein [Candidatus Bathyarchaeota archaeon]